LWDDVLEFCNPTRLFYEPLTEGKDKKPKVKFNSRAFLALTKASAGFQGYTANAMTDWYRLAFADPDLMDAPGVRDYLEKCERVMYAEFAKSGLYTSMGETTPDLHTCQAYLYEEEDVANKRIIFQAFHPKAAWVAEGSRGEINTIVMDHWWTAQAAFDRFGDKLTERKRDLAKKNPFNSITIRHIVKPMDARYLELSSNHTREQMPFVSIWYDQAESAILDVGGFWEFPYMVGRYAKNGAEVYARTPAHNALGDIMGANQMSRSRIQLGNRIADPTLVVPEDLEGSDDLLPGGRIYTQRDSQRIEPVALGANYPITVDNEERQDRIIDEHFNIPLYEMLQAADRTKTAREVIEMMGEKAALLVDTSSRYSEHFLQPIIRRSFNILYRAGRFPEPPKAILEAQGEGGLRVDFQGFLAQLQNKYFQGTGINAALGFAQGMAAAFLQPIPAHDNIDQDELMRQGLEANGVPATIIRERPDVEALRQQRAQAQAEAQQQAIQLQQSQTMTQNMDKLGKKPEDGSPIQQLGEALKQ
jgi:hypothetical protein